MHAENRFATTKFSSGGIEFKFLDSFFLRVCDRPAQRGLWWAGQIFKTLSLWSW